MSVVIPGVESDTHQWAELFERKLARKFDSKHVHEPAAGNKFKLEPHTKDVESECQVGPNSAQSGAKAAY